MRKNDIRFQAFQLPKLKFLKRCVKRLFHKPFYPFFCGFSIDGFDFLLFLGLFCERPLLLVLLQTSLR